MCAWVNDGIERARIERWLAPVALAEFLRALKQAAVDQYAAARS
jgi:hypothetical protein